MLCVPDISTTISVFGLVEEDGVRLTCLFLGPPTAVVVVGADLKAILMLLILLIMLLHTSNSLRIYFPVMVVSLLVSYI